MPRSSVYKVVKDILPAHLNLSKDACDLLLKCCMGARSLPPPNPTRTHTPIPPPPTRTRAHVIIECQLTRCPLPRLPPAEFVNLISFEANEISTAESSKMTHPITPQHVIAALQRLGFGDYVEDVQAAYDESKERPKKKMKRPPSSLTPEQLLAEQERLMNAAKSFLAPSSSQ